MTDPTVPGVQAIPSKTKRVRRTRDQLAAARGEALAADVSDLPLAQLETFTKALTPAVSQFIKTCLAQPR